MTFMFIQDLKKQKWTIGVPVNFPSYYFIVPYRNSYSVKMLVNLEVKIHISFINQMLLTK